MNKSLMLREMLLSPEVSYAMEAHNGISAKIVEEAGFPIIWASGFTISSSLGHRDCNEISWTNLCDQVGYMADATSIPILVDGDTGFGNFNNLRQLIIKLCKYGAAGVCVEDKIFPKTNSLLPYNQELTSIQEFCGKIKAAKDTQFNSDFCVIARTEAFISGNGLEEALQRAYSYKDAGADAILVHSKKSTIEEIQMFCNQWDYSIPIVIVPTNYPSTRPEAYQRLGISLVIWANHLLRASISAMRTVAQKIIKENSVEGITSHITTMKEVFELVNEDELQSANERYTI